MIKIIKEGNPECVKQKHTYRAVCPHCGCVYEYLEEDTGFSLYNMEGALIRTIDCPYCGETQIITNQIITKTINVLDTEKEVSKK